MPQLRKLRLGIDHLWPLIILAGLGFYTSLVPLPPNDFWWHLKIGELLVSLAIRHPNDEFITSLHLA